MLFCPSQALQFLEAEVASKAAGESVDECRQALSPYSDAIAALNDTGPDACTARYEAIKRDRPLSLDYVAGVFAGEL